MKDEGESILHVNENEQLISGLNEVQVLYVSAQKEFSERQSDG